MDLSFREFELALARCPNKSARADIEKLVRRESGRVIIADSDRPTMVAICQHKGFGAGDAVAFLASPAAKALDWMLGTSLASCGDCVRRKAKLNSLTGH